MKNRNFHQAGPTSSRPIYGERNSSAFNSLNRLSLDPGYYSKSSRQRQWPITRRILFLHHSATQHRQCQRDFGDGARPGNVATPYSAAVPAPRRVSTSVRGRFPTEPSNNADDPLPVLAKHAGQRRIGGFSLASTGYNSNSTRIRCRSPTPKSISRPS